MFGTYFMNGMYLINGIYPVHFQVGEDGSIGKVKISGWVVLNDKWEYQ